MTLRKLYEEIRSNVKKTATEMGYPEVSFELSETKPEFGDVSCNIGFLLAKPLGKRPYDISISVSEKYEQLKGPMVLEVKVHPSGYLNFVIDGNRLAKSVITSSLERDYGTHDLGKGERTIVEHTSVNPNKALHIGHVRNIIIGDTIARILRKANFDVKVLNYVDDSGLQVADILVGFLYGGFSKDPTKDQKFDHYCGDIVYVSITGRYESEPELAEKRSVVLKELEEGKSETASLGDQITRRVLEEQLKTCWRLGSEYDCLNFESQIIRSGLWKKIFEKMVSMGIVYLENQGKNSGCWVIRSESDLDEDKILVLSNGVATYIAKDIPYAAWKLGILDDPFSYRKYAVQKNDHVLWETTLEGGSHKMDFRGDRVITVIDSRQTRLQKIITKIISDFKAGGKSYLLLGYESVTLSPDTA